MSMSIPGGQAVVGMVSAQGGGRIAVKPRNNPMQKQIAHAPEPALRSQDTDRDVVPVARDAERPLPDARRKIARRADR